jgi:hypothetical protein
LIGVSWLEFEFNGSGEPPKFNAETFAIRWIKSMLETPRKEHKGGFTLLKTVKFSMLICGA